MLNLALGAFSEKDTSLSNLIPPCFYDLTHLVSVSYPPVFLIPGLCMGVGPQIGTVPESLWGLPNLEY